MSFHKTHLIIGSGPDVIPRYRKLCQMGKEEETGIVTSTPLPQKFTPLGPTLERGEEEVPSTALFFKELKFYPFGGRVKSQKLSSAEAYFLRPPQKDKKGEESPHSHPQPFTGIPQDIWPRQEGGYTIQCTSGTNLTCDYLHWMLGPRLFIKLYREKSPSSLVKFSETANYPNTLYVHFFLEGQLTDQQNTLFFPLSYTHSQGHFIGEFTKANSSQQASFMAFINTSREEEEAISHKIRVLDRQLEKAFANFKKSFKQKFIYFSDYSPLLNGPTTLLEQIKNDLPRVYFSQDIRDISST